MKLTKFRVAAAAAVFIVLAPAVAFAASPFADIIPGKFYEAPVEWALDNGITTGNTATTFEPDSPVTRGESVTFLKRYHDNTVKQTVGSLDCTTDQIPVFDGTIWTCGTDQTIPDTDADTMGDLDCAANQVAHYDGTNWTCKTIDLVFQPVPADTALDTGGDVGSYTSIAIGTDGYPIISYLDATNKDLKAYHCTAVDCSSGTAVGLDTSANDVDKYTSIAIGSDTFPVVIYMDWTDHKLKAFHCTAIDCSTGASTTLSTADYDGTYSSIAIGTDGFPIISYGTLSRMYLKSYHCTAVDCSSGAATSLDTDGNVGAYTSIAIGANTFPVISYADWTNNSLKAYHCTAIDCSTGSAITLDTNGDVGWYTSIAISADDKPVIAYYGFTNLDLRFAGARGTVLRLAFK